MIMGQEIAQGNERKVVVAVLRKEEEEVVAEVMAIKVTVVVSEAFGTKTFRKNYIWYWFVGGKIKRTKIIEIYIYNSQFIIRTTIQENE